MIKIQGPGSQESTERGPRGPNAPLRRGHRSRGLKIGLIPRQKMKETCDKLPALGERSKQPNQMLIYHAQRAQICALGVTESIKGSSPADHTPDHTRRRATPCLAPSRLAALSPPPRVLFPREHRLKSDLDAGQGRGCNCAWL